MNWTSVLFSGHFGLSRSPPLLVLYSCFAEGQALIAVYRGSGLLIFCLFLFALNVSGWHSRHINYVFIFELDPRLEDSPLNLLEVRVLAAVLCVLSFESLFVIRTVSHAVVVLLASDGWF